MLQLARTGAISLGSAEDVARACIQFERSHYVVLPKVFEPALLQWIQDQIGGAQFNQKMHQGIGVELCMTENSAFALLEFLTNDPRLFELVQQIAGCKRVGCFNGRVYRLTAASELYDSWHDDLGNNRMVGMSINLSSGVYRGGVLQISDWRSGEIVHDVANVGFGDAVIFRLARHLKHRVTNVEGTIPRTAFAGWFQSKPDFLSLLKEEGHDTR
jgi:hypothetical protein